MGYTGPSDACDQVPWGHSSHGLDLSLSGTFMCLLAQPAVTRQMLREGVLFSHTAQCSLETLDICM